MLREVAIRIELMVGITIVSVVCEVVLVEIIIWVPIIWKWYALILRLLGVARQQRQQLLHESYEIILSWMQQQ